ARACLVAGAARSRGCIPGPGADAPIAAGVAQLAVDKAWAAARSHRRADRHGRRLLCGVHADGTDRPAPRQRLPAPAARSGSPHLLAAAPGPAAHARAPARPVLTAVGA